MSELKRFDPISYSDMSELKRFDPISYSDMGGWSWDSGAIKECPQGDYVRFDDVETSTRVMSL